MFASLFQIARNTFRESLREPIFLLVLLSALCMIGIFPSFTLFVFREQIKLVVDSAMATTLVFGWITAVLIASYAIAREINNGTALLLLAKPVKRPVFILAKILGILLALAVFCLLTSVATLMSIRIAKDQFRLDNTVMAIYFAAIGLSLALGAVHNYVTRSSFPMAAVLALLVVLPATALGVCWLPAEGQHVGYSWHIVPALVLIMFAVWAMATLATALSTRFDLASNLTICSVFFVVGLMSDYLLGRHVPGSIIATVLYACVPNWQLFWMADALAAERQIPAAYVVFGALYVTLFIVLFIVVAVIMFWRREIGRQNLT